MGKAEHNGVRAPGESEDAPVCAPVARWWHCTAAHNFNKCFNWFERGDITCGQTEAASVAQMVRHTLADVGADPARVYVTGLSAGGAMTSVLLATRCATPAGTSGATQCGTAGAYMLDVNICAAYHLSTAGRPAA